MKQWKNGMVSSFYTNVTTDHLLQFKSYDLMTPLRRCVMDTAPDMVNLPIWSTYWSDKFVMGNHFFFGVIRLTFALLDKTQKCIKLINIKFASIWLRVGLVYVHNDWYYPFGTLFHPFLDSVRTKERRWLHIIIYNFSIWFKHCCCHWTCEISEPSV